MNTIRFGASLLLLAVIMIVLASCEDAADQQEPVSRVVGSNELKANELAALAASLSPADNAYDNAARASSMYAEARRMPRDLRAFQLFFKSAVESVRAGDTEEGLRRLDEAQAILDEVGGRPHPSTTRSMLELRGMAMLRLGEQDNCLENHSPESCLMPMSGGGIHEIQRGSQGAVEIYTTLLEQSPDSPTYRWLLNLAHMTLGEYPTGVDEQYRIDPDIFASSYDIKTFHDRAAGLGIDHMALAGGSIMDDFNGDGLLDIVCSSWGTRDQMHYYQRTMDGGFENRTAASGLDGQIGGLNLTHADFDNDGDLDILVLRGGWMFDLGQQPNSLLRNEGDGTFVDVTVEAGLGEPLPSQTACWGDYDNDGWLDLCIGNEVSSSSNYPMQLFHNNHDGTFTDVASSSGISVPGLVKGVTWGDFDNDGLLDLYVSRFGESNVLLHNQGASEDDEWTFVDVTEAAGVGDPVQSFPAWWFDFDNDGWLDLFVASFTGFQGSKLDACVSDFLGLPSDGARCHLYRNNGDGTFEDVAAAAGLDRVLPVMGANFGDLDNDGWLDCLLGTGEPRLTTLVPNVVLRNQLGESFDDVTTSGAFGNIQKGHGVAFGDIDGDGDQDIYVTMGGAFSGDIYPNSLLENPGHGNHWITLRFEAVESNRFAIGARVSVAVETPQGERTIHRVVGSGGSFGCSSLQLEIGLGDALSINSIEVRWPTTDQVDVFPGPALDRVLLVREGEKVLSDVDTKTLPLATNSMGHSHKHH